MLIRTILFFGLATFPAVAADPPNYVIWPKGLPAEGSPQKIQFEHHSWSLAHREKSGVVESHGTRTIVMIVQSGEATLVVGTDVVDAKSSFRGDPRHLHPQRNREKGVSRRYHQYARRAAPSVPSRARKANYLHRCCRKYPLKKLGRSPVASDTDFTTKPLGR